MDLTPLYDLRDRLRAGAIAGAALVMEDFRLKRALDALAPLEQASPVFAKLGQLTRTVLSPDCPDRAGALLDALTLADAVLCTQGAVNAPAPLEPVAIEMRGDAVTNAPYSVLAPLLEALTTSGSGKYSFVLDTHETRPELFADYRVKAAMVQALGAAYGELADQVEKWLSQEDGSILPLLQSGFDPKGKKDMVRRVRVMEAVAGAAANDFYLEQIPKADKDVRAALIYALRLDGGNTEKLLELCKTEKGACKKQAQFALAKLDTPAAWAYWDAMAAKKAEQTAEFMTLSTSEKASALVARAVGQWLEPFEASLDCDFTQSSLERIEILFAALPGKSGPEICECYRRMAALGMALDNKTIPTPNGQTYAVRLRHRQEQNLYYAQQKLAFSEAVPMVLWRSLLFHPAPDLLALTGELERTSLASYAVPVITAALLSQDGAGAYAAAEPFLTAGGPLRRKQKKEAMSVLQAALDGLVWDGGWGELAYSATFHDPAAGQNLRIVRPLHARLDPRWYEQLIAHPGEDADALLARLLPRDDPALCRQAGEHLYQRALVVKDNRRYLDWLRECGWTECRGLFESYCRHNKVSNWDVHAYLARMPSSAAARADEVERVLNLVQEKKIAVHTVWNPTSIRQWILDTRNKAEPIPLTGGEE